MSGERQMIVHRFSDISSAFNFGLADRDINIKKYLYFRWWQTKWSVAQYETPIEFQDTFNNILCLAYLKHEPCSQQCSVKTVFINVMFPW